MVRKNIKDTIKNHNLINAGEHIVIGLSGGPDSVCLFSVLNELKEELGITLHAVHVNHGFRPGAAEEDQAYVENMCRELGSQCTSFVYDCNAIAAAEGLSSEEAGRKVRYESFLKVAEALMQGNYGCSMPVPADKIKIAVAQNADDQAETVLFRLLRGTGTDGLAGIAYSRMEKNIMVIRPLLDTWRKDIEAYCSECGLEPRTDHTNLQPVYTRNKIRLELIPYLQENFNANIMEALGRLSRIASEDKTYLWQCAEDAYERLQIAENILSVAEEVTAESACAQGVYVTLNQKGLEELAPAVRHRVVMKALQQIGMTQDITASHLEAVDSILGSGGESKTVEFPDGYRMSVRYGEAAFYRVTTVSAAGSVSVNFDQKGLAASGDRIAGLSVSVCQIDEIDAKCHMPDQETHEADTKCHAETCQTARFDAGKIIAVHGETEIVLRTRMEGDFLAIKGGRKKIQDLFVDMKVPKEHRDNVLMAAAGSEILWLPVQKKKGVERARYSHRYKLEQDTKNVLTLEIVCDI